MSELTGGAATRSTLRAKGVDNEHTNAFLQPIVVEKHLIGNPWVIISYTSTMFSSTCRDDDFYLSHNGLFHWCGT